MADIEEDFLENDDEIRGQNYCLISFLSPEKVIKNKTMYFIDNFLRHIAPDYDLNPDKISEKYLDFMYTREENLSNEFNKNNEFRTSIRGVKVRGTYESLKEAQIKAKRIQNRDKNFHVFVGQVGYWLPWDPQADYIENQEFMNQELNHLMKEYKANGEHKDILYEELKSEKINKIKKENELVKKQNDEEVVRTKVNLEPEPETSDAAVSDAETSDAAVSETSVVTEPEAESETSAETNAIFNSDDAWVQQNLRK